MATSQYVRFPEFNPVTVTPSPGSIPWIVQETKASTAVETSVSSSATNVTLLAANALRLGATFFNNSTQNLYLKFGATATNASFTVILSPSGYYELPTPHLYTGIIDGIWASANGALLVTELTA